MHAAYTNKMVGTVCITLCHKSVPDLAIEVQTEVATMVTGGAVSRRPGSIAARNVRVSVALGHESDSKRLLRHDTLALNSCR